MSDSYALVNDAFPTSQWQAGEIWTGKFQVRIDAGAAPGDLSVFVFLTDAQSDETLPLQTSAPIRDLEIKGFVSPQNRLVHAVRIAASEEPWNSIGQIAFVFLFFSDRIAPHLGIGESHH